MIQDLLKALILGGEIKVSKEKKGRNHSSHYYKPCYKPCDKSKERNEREEKYDPKCCDLTIYGQYCDALDFVVDNYNLAYSKCENFPKLTRCYIKSIGLDTLIQVAETIPTGTSGDRTSAINEAFLPYSTYYFGGIPFTIRLTLTKTDGTVLYDSVVGTNDTDASEMQLHTTRMEIQRATERTWGLAQRLSSTTGIRYQYASIWIPKIVLIQSVGDLNPDTEVINFRIAYEIYDNGKPKPNGSP